MIKISTPWVTVDTRLTRAILGVEGTSNVVIVPNKKLLIYDAGECEYYDLCQNGLSGVALDHIDVLDVDKLLRWSNFIESLLIYNKEIKVLDYDEYKKDPEDDFDEAQNGLASGWCDSVLANF